MDAQEQKKIVKAFKALANNSRLIIYLELMQREQVKLGAEHGMGCKLVDLINRLNVGAPTISHHVKELVNADLVDVERTGRELTLKLNAAMQLRLQEVLSGRLKVVKKAAKTGARSRHSDNLDLFG